ncbi:MAG: M3 family oligoendopeptidase [Candidatus Paceibacterota bacterium]
MKKNTWDLRRLAISATDPKIKRERTHIDKKITTFIEEWGPRVDQLSNPKTLRTALDAYEFIRATHGTEGDSGYYFWLRGKQDQTNTIIKAHKNEWEEFATKQENRLMFFTHAIAHISPKKQASLLISPLLKPYKHFLEKLWTGARYLLSEPEEKLNDLLMGPAHGDWIDLTATLIAKSERVVYDADNKKKKLSFSQILSLLSNHKKQIRDVAGKAINEIVYQYLDIAEAELNAILKRKKILDEIRGFKRPDQSRYMGDDVDINTIDVLLKTVSQNNEVARKFYKLKAKLLGKKQLAYHERNIEIATKDIKYSFTKSISLVTDVLEKLNPQFGTIIDAFVSKHCIDVYPTTGKSGGAFCVHMNKSQPVYILLNHTNKLQDVLTLAHELGHGINNEYMRKQNGLNYNTTLATAEVASTFMEDFVFERLIQNVSEKTMLELIMKKLDNDIATIFRQVACVQFEQELHDTYNKTGYVSKEVIGKLFSKHMSAYMGAAIEQSPGSQNWWVHWSHIRRFFYNYSYAHGLLISKALQARVRNDHTYITQIEQFLSAGTSQSPHKIFSSMGIDTSNPEFWKSGVHEVTRLLNKATALAKKLGKI